MWEFVGRLQRNKVRGLVGRVALVHSVDRPALVSALDVAAARAAVVQPVLLQVNVDGDASKAGVAPDEVPAALAQLEAAAGLRCEGLMTVPARDGDPRRTFAALRALRDDALRRHPDCRQLSMGMSADLETAVAEGATVVRVGRAVFGPAAPARRQRPRPGRPDRPGRPGRPRVGPDPPAHRTHRSDVMASVWKRTMTFLGLVEDYDDEYLDAHDEPERRVPETVGAGRAGPGRPDPSNVRRIAPARGAGLPDMPPQGVPDSGTVRPITSQKVHLTEPMTFNDVEEVGSHFRGGTPVIMNLAGASESVAKRMLDFASGLIYGLDGRIERVGDRVFLLSPLGTEVSSEERRRLSERGFFNQA